MRACAALAASGFVCYNAGRSQFNRNGPGIRTRSSGRNCMISRRTAICLIGNRPFGNRFDRQRLGAGLSDAAGALGGRISARRRHRHHRAADRPAAVGEARPAIRDRKQARRRQQHRHRIGGQCRTGRLHGAAGQSGELHQRLALRQSEVQFRPRHRAGRVLQSRAERDDGQQGRDRRKPSPSSSPMRRPIPAR